MRESGRGGWRCGGLGGRGGSCTHTRSSPEHRSTPRLPASAILQNDIPPSFAPQLSASRKVAVYRANKTPLPQHNDVPMINPQDRVFRSYGPALFLRPRIASKKWGRLLVHCNSLAVTARIAPNLTGVEYRPPSPFISPPPSSLPPRFKSHMFPSSPLPAILIVSLSFDSHKSSLTPHPHLSFFNTQTWIPSPQKYHPSKKKTSLIYAYIHMPIAD